MHWYEGNSYNEASNVGIVLAFCNLVLGCGHGNVNHKQNCCTPTFQNMFDSVDVNINFYEYCALDLVETLLSISEHPTQLPMQLPTYIMMNQILIM